MMDRIRRFLNTRAGSALSLGLTLVAILVAGWFIISSLGGGEAADLTGSRVFMCTETGKSFNARLQDGWTVPVPSPHSGKNTGVPAEQCVWTKEGTIKSSPTYVLLNQYVGKPEPTFCPECDRLVVMRNPIHGAQETNVKPPPTKAEYANRGRGDLEQ